MLSPKGINVAGMKKQPKYRMSQGLGIQSKKPGSEYRRSNFVTLGSESDENYSITEPSRMSITMGAFSEIVEEEKIS